MTPQPNKHSQLQGSQATLDFESGTKQEMHLHLIGPALCTHILLWLFWFLLCIKFFNSITTSVSFSGSGDGGGVITCSCQTSSVMPSSRGGGNGTSARGGTSIITWKKISIRVIQLVTKWRLHLAQMLFHRPIE